MDKETINNKSDEPSPKKRKKNLTPNEELKTYVNTLLEDTKAQDIVCIDLAGKTILADYMFIASGTSTRHVSSIAENIADKIKEKFEINCRTEGLETGDWVVIDAFDAVIHIFKPEVREFYNLEKLWAADFSDTSFTLYKR